MSTDQQGRQRRAVAMVVRKVSLYEQPAESTFWRERPYAERLAALEQIREEYHRCHFLQVAIC